MNDAVKDRNKSAVVNKTKSKKNNNKSEEKQ